MNAAKYRFLTGLLAAACLITLSGCSDDDDNPAGPGDSGATIAVVQTSGDDEENLSVIDYKTGTAYNDLLPLGGISNLYQYGDYVYIVDKENNRIIKFDPFTRTAMNEMSTGAGTAPYCMVFISHTKASSIILVYPQNITAIRTVTI